MPSIGAWKNYNAKDMIDGVHFALMELEQQRM